MGHDKQELLKMNQRDLGWRAVGPLSPISTRRIRARSVVGQTPVEEESQRVTLQSAEAVSEPPQIQSFLCLIR